MKHVTILKYHHNLFFSPLCSISPLWNPFLRFRPLSHPFRPFSSSPYPSSLSTSFPSPIMTSTSSSFSSLSPIESSKRSAAYAAVDTYVFPNCKIGVGSGSTVVYAIDRLAEREKEEKLNLVCVVTSFQSEELCLSKGLKVLSLNECTHLDVTIDGADECDENFNLIKGGGACQLREKVVAEASHKLIIIADYRKNSKKLGENWTQGIPIEVVPMAWKSIKGKIENIPSEVWGNNNITFKGILRMATKKAGPVVTDNGNFVLDVVLSSPLECEKVEEINRRILSISGVVESGLFVNMVERIYFGMADGTVTIRDNEKKTKENKKKEEENKGK